MPNPIRLDCEGFTIGALQLPAFQLRVGDFICLHAPYFAESTQEHTLVQALTGSRPIAGLHRFGRIEWAAPAMSPRGLLRLLRRPRPADWLCSAAKLSRSEARMIGDRLGIRSDVYLDQLAYNPRRLLGLEAAWARGADVIVFTTVGCDPRGVQAIRAAVSERLDRCPAIRLCYEFCTDGQKRRECFAGATRIELSFAPAQAVPHSITPSTPSRVQD
jgi:hypothetical protein